MEDDPNIKHLNTYLNTKQQYQSILNEFNYYRHEMTKENLNLKIEYKSHELNIRNLVKSIITKEEELCKIEMDLIDLEYENKGLKEQLETIKEKVSNKKDILHEIKLIAAGIIQPPNEIIVDKETDEIKIFREKFKQIKDENHILSEEYKKRKSESLKFQV